MKFHYRNMLSPAVKEIINNVDKVFLLSTDVMADKSILSYCNLINRDVFVAVHSWDNLPSRGYFGGVPTKILVWNKVIMNEAIDLHGIDIEKIEIIGVPQYSLYRKLTNQVKYSDFLEFYKLNDSDKKVLTYTCSAYRVIPDEPLLINALIEFALKKNLYFILRLHPTERKDEYINKYSSIENVIIDNPGGEFAATAVDNLHDGVESIKKFIALMKYSNVVTNLASTVTLDAIIFDTPVVCPTFNYHPGMKGRWNEAKRQYSESTHFKIVVKSKAIRLASSRDEMEAAIQSYIDNPDLDKEYRKKLADDFCMINMDASQRIYDVIN